ncbi:hypothetical protein NDU88_008166 [Pleurodeles waltl]|uniref:Uncharacterized protein n=1 Tax=Pleurodeles waltl TaxID=8319 RepID=A0AAV7N464_PLEWA|nr:hypothetical protein NDU88_008166 [Pleurodeles waltl]
MGPRCRQSVTSDHGDSFYRPDRFTLPVTMKVEAALQRYALSDSRFAKSRLAELVMVRCIRRPATSADMCADSGEVLF